MSAMRAGIRLTLLAGGLAAAATTVGAPAPVRPTWTARWISVAEAPAFDYGVYHFRRTFSLPERPARFVVHVTADNRYQLFVNGARVLWGPARGDLDHWRYETLDLAPYLKAGTNVLAAVVWNFGVHAPQAQQTQQTGFLLQGDGEAEKVADTGKTWKGVRNEAYTPLPVAPEEIHFQYYVAGPGDRVDGRAYPWGWEATEFDDSPWPAAREGPRAAARGAVDSPSRWMLVPRTIPAMEEHPLRLARVRRATGVTVPPSFPASVASFFTVAPHARATVLLDQGHLTTAYPELTVSGGRGAVITLRQAEALLLPGSKQKGHRDEVDGKELRGARDTFVAAADRGGRSGRSGGAPTATSSSRSRPRTPPSPSTTWPPPPPSIRSSERRGWRRTGRSWSRSSTSAGARPGCARTRPTWTARTTSNSSTPATRASRRWCRST